MKELNLDGMVNVISGINKAGVDKRVAAQHQWARMTEVEADIMYSGDDIMGRIVDRLPMEAMREGWQWLGEDQTYIDQLETRWDDLNLTRHIHDAWIMARLYGGSGLLIITQTADMEKPLAESEAVIGFQPLSRWELIVDGSNINADLTSRNFGKPNAYNISVNFTDPNINGRSASFQPVHHSRIITFDGTHLQRRLYITNGYWHDSVLSRVRSVVRNYQLGHEAVSATLEDFTVGVWKMKNLSDLIAAGHEGLIRQKIEMANYCKSVLRSIILDEEEDYTEKARQVTGMSELVKLLGERMVAATDMPHTILLGESPSGSNATGNSTVLQWYDHVSSVQESYLKPKVMQITKALTGGQLPKDLSLEFRPLWQMDEKELAQLHLTQAQADAVYMQSGVIDPDEVAASRFGGTRYSTETDIDMATRATPSPVAAVQNVLGGNPGGSETGAGV